MNRKVRQVGVLAVVTGVMAGCSSLGGGQAQPPQKPTSATSTRAAAASFATVDQALLPSTRATLKQGKLNVTQMLVGERMPGLAYALEIVRGHILRQHDWREGTGALTVTPRLVASSSKVVGVTVTAADDQGRHTAAIWYDPMSNTAHSSPALIKPDKWAAFTQAVVAKGGKAVAPDLSKPSWPMGTGPALGFSKDGDLVVQFQGQGRAPVLIPAKEVSPLLTELGLRAKAGSQYPTAAEGADSFVDAPALAEAGAPADPRPSLVVGTDCGKVKCISVTFDDGPVPETKDVVAAFAKEKVPATFFMLGTSVDENPAVVTAVSAAGMEIASHNQKHNAMTTVGDAVLAQQVSTSRARLRQLAGTDPLFLRPPYGDRSQRVDRVIGAHGMAVAIWSVDTMDWKNKSTPAILSNIDREHSNGGVVLMHDIHPTSRAAVPAVIAKLKDEGYTIVTLAELAPNSFRYGTNFCTSPSREKKPCRR